MNFFFYVQSSRPDRSYLSCKESSRKPLFNEPGMATRNHDKIDFSAPQMAPAVRGVLSVFVLAFRLDILYRLVAYKSLGPVNTVKLLVLNYRSNSYTVRFVFRCG